MFHHIIGKLLYVSKRARIDVDLTTAILCTRVSKSNVQDWCKLKRLLAYLKGTIGIPRIIGASTLQVMYTWVDTSFAVHNDMRGHTGGVTSFDTGVVTHKSAKQKINTKSSTETDLVCASEYFSCMLWIKRFMDKQGYPMKTVILYHDNQSAMNIKLSGH